MNATQASHLLKSVNAALEMLPNGLPVAMMLQAAVDAVRAPATKPTGKPSKRKGGASYKPFTAEECAVPHVFQGTIDEDGAITFRNDIRDTACLCPACRIVRGFFERGLNAPTNDTVSDISRHALRSRLSRCVCGHMATIHAEDENANLLKCSLCDCDHFHYGIAEAA